MIWLKQDANSTNNTQKQVIFAVFNIRERYTGLKKKKKWGEN